MLELLVGIDLARRLTHESLTPEPARRRRRPTTARRSPAAAARDFLSEAVAGLAGPTAVSRPPSRLRHTVRGARAD